MLKTNKVQNVSDAELANWSRHYDTLLWNTTTIFAGLFGGLIVFCFQSFHLSLTIAGLFLCPVPVFFAASFRESRNIVNSKMSKNFRATLFSGRRVIQWPVYIMLFIALESLYFNLLCAHRPEYIVLWSFIFLAVAFSTAGGIRLGRIKQCND